MVMIFSLLQVGDSQVTEFDVIGQLRPRNSDADDQSDWHSGSKTHNVLLESQS